MSSLLRLARLISSKEINAVSIKKFDKVEPILIPRSFSNVGEYFCLLQETILSNDTMVLNFDCYYQEYTEIVNNVTSLTFRKKFHPVFIDDDLILIREHRNDLYLKKEDLSIFKTLDNRNPWSSIDLPRGLKDDLKEQIRCMVSFEKVRMFNNILTDGETFFNVNSLKGFSFFERSRFYPFYDEEYFFLESGEGLYQIPREYLY